MKPAYWIGIMAMIGAILAHFIFGNALYGIVAGILIGALIYGLITARNKRSG